MMSCKTDVPSLWCNAAAGRAFKENRCSQQAGQKVDQPGCESQCPSCPVGSQAHAEGTESCFSYTGTPLVDVLTTLAAAECPLLSDADLGDETALLLPVVLGKLLPVTTQQRVDCSEQVL